MATYKFKMCRKTAQVIKRMLTPEPGMEGVSGFDIPVPEQIDAAMAKLIDTPGDEETKNTALICMAIVMLNQLDAYTRAETEGRSWLTKVVFRTTEE